MIRKMPIVVLLCVASVSFAAEAPWAASWNRNGQINVYVSAGIDYLSYGFATEGIGAVVALGAELVIGEFRIAGIPFDWGVQARGTAGLDLSRGFDGLCWTAAPLVGLHVGLAMGLDVYLASGIGFYGDTWGLPFWYGPGVIAGFAYRLSDRLSVFAEFGLVVYSYSASGGLLVKIP